LWNSVLISAISFRVCIALKKFTQVLSYVVCTQVRRHVHKKITKRRYRDKKPGRFVFGKPILFPLGLGLTKPYSLGILLWNFYQTFVTVSIEFWLTFWAPDSSHKTGNKFFIHHYQSWKEGSFVCKTVWFYSWVNTHPFDQKFVAFCPKFSGNSYVEFQAKIISGEFFRNFVQTKTILYRNLWNSALISAISFWVRIALKKLTQVLSYVVWPREGGTSIKQSQKEDTGKKGLDVLFSKNQFCSLSVWDSLRLTPWYFGLKF